MSQVDGIQKRGKVLRAVLFDLDGVLVDSLEVMASAWREVRNQIGVAVPFEVYAAEIGRPFDDIIVRIGCGSKLLQIKAIYHTAAARDRRKIVVYPGVPLMIQTLQGAGVRVGVVTSKPRNAAVSLLDQCGIEYECLKTPEDGVGKPAPDLLHQAVGDVCGSADETVYVGDMEVDERAAMTASIPFIHAAWGYGKVGEKTISASCPADLTSALIGDSTGG